MSKIHHGMIIRLEGRKILSSGLIIFCVHKNCLSSECKLFADGTFFSPVFHDVYTLTNVILMQLTIHKWSGLLVENEFWSRSG